MRRAILNASHNLRRYSRIWVRMAQMSLRAQMSYGLGSLGFLLGKIVRLVFFFFYVSAIFKHTDRLAGYTLAETTLFFLTFNLVDIASQVLFKGVYSAKHVVTEGDLDYYLIQPCSALFRIANCSVDFMDALTFTPVFYLFISTWHGLPGPIRPSEIFFYLLLLANGIAIALAMHIVVAALAVRTQEMENAIWVYRETMFLGRFPVDIYAAPLRWALTFCVPIAVMTTFPAKALLGILQAKWIAYSLFLGTASLAASLGFWRQALRKYTSVSS